MKKNKFNPGIRITIFFVFFAILFFSLGLWQIERGQFKNQILIEFEKNITKNPSYLNANSEKWDRVSFERSRVVGLVRVFDEYSMQGGFVQRVNI